MSGEMKIPAGRVLPLAIIEALNQATGSNEWQGDESPATLIGPAVAAITRLSTPERDLRRFPDAAFNEWLEEPITENSEFTVRDSMKDLDSAYSAWCARPYYAASPPPPEDGWKPIDHLAFLSGPCQMAVRRFAPQHGQTEAEFIRSAVLAYIRPGLREAGELLRVMRDLDQHLPFDWAFDGDSQYVGKSDFREAVANFRAALAPPPPAALEPKEQQ